MHCASVPVHCAPKAPQCTAVLWCVYQCLSTAGLSREIVIHTGQELYQVAAGLQRALYLLLFRDCFTEGTVVHCSAMYIGWYSIEPYIA